MRKIYQAPITNMVLVRSQLMLGGSMTVNTDSSKAVETTDILSREDKRSFSAWGEDEEEDY